MAITLTVNPPPGIESVVRAGTPNLDATAKEALLVVLYRQGKLSHCALSEALGLDRFQVESVLKRHNVTEDLGSAEEYLHDARTLDALLNRDR